MVCQVLMFVYYLNLRDGVPGLHGVCLCDEINDKPRVNKKPRRSRQNC